LALVREGVRLGSGFVTDTETETLRAAGETPCGPFIFRHSQWERRNGASGG